MTMRIEAFRCARCDRRYTASEMMRAYQGAGCVCGDNGSWERVTVYVLPPELADCYNCGAPLTDGELACGSGVCEDCEGHCPVYASLRTDIGKQKL